MKNPAPLLLLTIGAFVAAAADPVAACAAPQDPPPAKPEESPKVAECAQYLKELPPLMAKQNEMEAKASIEKLKGYWKDAEIPAETKKAIPGLIARYTKDLDKVALLVAGIDALAELGPDEGAKPILEVLNRGLKAKEPSVDVYGAALRGLKRLADPSKGTVGTLIDLLKHRENEVISKAADAIAGYKDAPGKVRKELLEELIKSTEGVFANSKNSSNTNDVRKWNMINFNVMQALRALSGQQFKDPAEARAWFNEHKKDKSWN